MKKFIIKRSGALGDVILTTPIARHLRVLHPNAHITISTNSPDAYLYNTDVNAVLSVKHDDSQAALINLDRVYENSPKMHVIDAYALEAFGTTEIDKRTFMYQPEGYDNAMRQELKSLRLDPDMTVIIHAAKSWENRTLPSETWLKIIRAISETYNVIIVGSGEDYSMTGQNIYDFKNKLTVHHLRALIMECRAFVGMDSGVLHIAGTTNTKMIGIFTCAKSEYRMPLHRDSHSYECPLPCYGCLHEQPVPVVHVGCDRGDLACVKQFDTDDFISKTMSWLVE